jgi:hypothetical protein
MYDYSIAGIRSNLELFARSAEKLQNVEKAAPARETANMVIAEKGVAANTVALRSAMEMSRYVLDILA